MVAKDRRPWPHGTGDAPSPPVGLDELVQQMPPADLAERRPVLRLAPGRGSAVAAERLLVPERTLAAVLGSFGEDADLRRHAADRIAARLPGTLFPPGAARSEAPLGGIPPRMPVLLPLPLRPLPVPAPRPGLIGVLPLAAATEGIPWAERRGELGALGWRLGIGEVDAAALRFVSLAALQAAADVLLLRWSPLLARQGRDALRDADPQALVLTGCDGPDSVRWGQGAGVVLFSGPGAEAMLAPASPAAEVQ
jgi:hypothetical protein